MSALRFEGTREVFEAFPTAHKDISAAPTDDPPLVFLRSLAISPKPENALAFCAYLLPRREAVWWASQCVRAIIGTPSQRDEVALRTAEDWAQEPIEEKRHAALEIAMAADRSAASTWVAFAAAWSGGKLVISEHAAALAPPELTPKAVFAALLIALAGTKDRAEKIEECIQGAVTILRT
jgi:hypothetical protein